MSGNIEDMIIRLLSGEELGREERRAFEAWYAQPGNEAYFYRMQCLYKAIHAEKSGEQIRTEAAWMKIRPLLKMRISWRKLLSYAAILLLPLCAGISFYLLRPSFSPKPTEIYSENILPGRKQAILTLSDGRKIPLSDSLPVPIIHEKGTVIQSFREHVLEYRPTVSSGKILYNTVQVPRGGEYMLMLADSTKVWINSDSRITYPIAFTGNSREVRLEGEAYFEVQKQNGLPFIVHTGEFDIRVTGTRFNVRTYPEEPATATLEAGSIQFLKDRHVYNLRPGQQAVSDSEGTHIREVDLEEAIAWRYETFCFKERRLENILNELARWYDMDIFYQNPETKNFHFTAWFRRSSSIEEVLDILEKTKKIKLQLQGKTLTVQSK